MKKFLLVANREKAGALELAEKARAWLDGKAEIVGLESRRDVSLEAYPADVVVVFGGDGTVLDAIRRLGKSPPPLLTVNLGRFGYLTEVNPDEIEAALARVLAGQHRLSQRMFLHGQVLEGEREIWHGHAVNEFVVAPASPGRMIEIGVQVQNHDLMRFSGDGLIVASPTGSTAYSLSAGGPVVSPELRATLLVPICPHQLANRPLVLDGSEILSVRHYAAAPARFSFDGQEAMPFTPGQRLEIKASGRSYSLILVKDRQPYDILRAKLGWGGEAPGGD